MQKTTFMIAAISVGFFFTSAASEGWSGPPDFRGTVQKVTENGRIVFEGNTSYRLWGIIPDVDYLRALIVGKFLICKQAGTTFRKRGDIIVPIHAVYCTQGFPDPYPEGNLIEHLLETGHATEYCAETGNLLGTCDH